MSKITAAVTITVRVSVPKPSTEEEREEVELRVLNRVPDLLWKLIKSRFIDGEPDDSADYAVNLEHEFGVTADEKAEARKEGRSYVSGKIMLKTSELLELEAVRDYICMRLCGELLDKVNIVHDGNDVNNIHITAAGLLLPEE
jgi:hypothetical protein